MNCLDCQDVLQRRLDGEIVPVSVELEQHLAECSACRQTHLAAQVLVEGLRTLPPITPVPQFTQKLVAAIRHDRVVRQQRMRLKLWATIGMAAAILLMASAGYIWLPKNKSAVGIPSPPMAEGKKPDPDPAPVAPPLSPKVDEVRDAVVAFTDRLADQTRSQARLLLAAAPPMEVPMANRNALPPLEEPLDPAAESLRHAGQGLSEGFTTVARNARRAVDYFVKELPALDMPN